MFTQTVSLCCRKVIDKIDQSEFEGFEYVNPLLMSQEDCVWDVMWLSATVVAQSRHLVAVLCGRTVCAEIFHCPSSILLWHVSHGGFAVVGNRKCDNNDEVLLCWLLEVNGRIWFLTLSYWCRYAHDCMRNVIIYGRGHVTRRMTLLPVTVQAGATVARTVSMR